MAADREALINTGDDLLPRVMIDDAGAEIEPLIVDRGLLGDADRRGLVHLADIGEAHVILERGGEGVAADHLALLVLRLGRGITPHHMLFVIELLDRPIEPHQFTPNKRERFDAKVARVAQRTRWRSSHGDALASLAGP